MKDAPIPSTSRWCVPERKKIQYSQSRVAEFLRKETRQRKPLPPPIVKTSTFAARNQRNRQTAGTIKKECEVNRVERLQTPVYHTQ